jgi:DnaJ-class molecular chaperone
MRNNNMAIIPDVLDLLATKDLENHGYKYCDHCNGYGSSLKDPSGVDTCTKCNGTGVQKKLDKNTVS